MGHALLRPVALLLALLPVPPAVAEGVRELTGADHAPGRRVLEFSHDVAAGPTEALCVLGDLEVLGAGDVTRALRMGSEDGIRWTVTVEAPCDESFRYSFVLRDQRSKHHADPTNGLLVAGPFPGPGRGSDCRGGGSRTLRVRSDTAPVLHWRRFGEAEFRRASLAGVRDPRGGAPGWWELREASSLPRRVQFFLTDAASGRRSPPAGLFDTEFSEIWVQNGQVFAYRPAPQVSAPRLEPVRTIHSAARNEDHTYRVRLPRGYDEHPERRYPVLYLLERRIWWGRCGTIGGTLPARFDCDGEIMADLVRRGVIDEILVVALDVPGFLCERQQFLTAPEDLVISEPPCGGIHGEADLSLRFLADELKPRIDVDHRSLPTPRDTFVAGFSAGGNFALYCALGRPDAIGGAAALSGGWGITPVQLSSTLAGAPPVGVRLYLDAGDDEGLVGGTLESSILSLQHTLALVDRFETLPRPLVVGRSLAFQVVPFAGHGPFSPELRIEAMLRLFAPRAR